MTPTSLLILVILLVILLFAAGSGLKMLRGRSETSSRRPDAPARPTSLESLRNRVARLIAPGSSARDRRPGTARPRPGQVAPRRVADPRGARSAGPTWLTRPDLQPAQTLSLPGTTTLEEEWPPGLTVAALAAGPASAQQQDVYYVQRNLIALARGLTDIGEGQRAAALALSAVMTSRLGQTADIDQALQKGVSAANRLVRSISKRDPHYSDMVTTLDVVFVAFDSGESVMHFAHVGNSAIWLQRAGSPSVELLTEPHVVDGGPMLKAIGLTGELKPDIGRRPVEVGDRIYLTTKSPYFTFTGRLMNGTVGDRAGRPLHEAIATLAEAVNSSSTPDEVMIVGAELARPATFHA